MERTVRPRFYRWCIMRKKRVELDFVVANEPKHRPCVTVPIIYSLQLKFSCQTVRRAIWSNLQGNSLTGYTSQTFLSTFRQELEACRAV